MLPLTLAKAGDELMVAKTGGSRDIKKHLEDLGFTAGTPFKVVTVAGNGNIIVNMKDSRLAITEEMSGKIHVVPCNGAK